MPAETSYPLRTLTHILGNDGSDRIGRSISSNIFSAASDGTDISGEFTAAVANGPVFLPTGTYNAPSFNELGTWKTWGFGHIKDDNGNQRGPWHTGIDTEPVRLGAWSSSDPQTWFNADFSGVHIAGEQWLSSTAMGTSAGTGAYVFRRETASQYFLQYNGSGYHDATNGDRTGVVTSYIDMFQAGQGDQIAYYASGIVTSTNPDSTDWIKAPNVTHSASGLFAGVANCFLNSANHQLADQGHDCAALGIHLDCLRDNGTGFGDNMWGGYSISSHGSAAMDFAYGIAAGSATDFRAGLDFTRGGFGTDKAAHVVAAGHRFYFDGTSGTFKLTSPGTKYLTYNSTDFAFVGADLVAPHYKVGADQVLGARQTGWNAPTGTLTRGTFSAAATLATTAQTLAALITDLRTHGMINT